MNKSYLVVLAMILTQFAFGQELSYGYYNYVLNRYNFNPAFAGNNGNVTAMLNTKTYMAGFSDAPRNTMFGLHAPINSVQGIGGRVFSDKRGAYEVNKYDITYSYQIKFDENSDLRFGFSAGAIRRMLNARAISNSEFLDPTDPTLASGYYDETNFTAGVGLVYDYDKFQFGLSAPHLVEGSEDISEFIVGTFSYIYQFENKDFTVQPIVVYQNLPVIENRYDVLLKGEYKEKIWLQVGYQSTQNMNFGLGFDLGPFGIGYSYEMNNSDLNNISNNSNEVIIRLSFLPAKQRIRNEALEMLDEYVAKFNAMLKDQGDNFNKQEVMDEIKKIRAELMKLEKSNDKKTAKQVEKRLDTIEEQIIELEKKYKN